MSETPTIDSWHQCYSDGWKGTISDSSFSHPAKFAKGLIFRIVQHALDEGFLKPGDTALDCFGGVGLGGLPCALQGIQHIAVELEPRFVALATGFDCGGASAKHECCPVTEAEGLFGHGPHHVEGNLELWQRLYGAQPQWVAPRMIEGDSRNLREVIEAADCCVASPPFVDSDGRKGGSDLYYKNRVQTGRNPQAASAQHQTTTQPYGSSPHNLGNMSPGSVDACLSSPPHCHGLGKEHTYADHAKREKDSQRGIMREKGIADPFYGDNPAQMGNMPAGTLDACVASPPFSGTEQPCASQSRGLKDYHAFTRGNGTKCDATHTGETPGQLSAMATGEVAACVSSPPYANGCTHTGGMDPAPEHIQGGEMRYVAYSASETNLGNMPAGDVTAVVSSPPYEGGGHHKGAFDTWGGQLQGNKGCAGWATKEGGYGANPENMGNTQGDTFWSAARTILEQVYALLKPGGVAIFVVKSYIRDRQIVDFPGQWRRLCEHVGFQTLHEHHALLVDSHSEMGLFGEEVEMYRKSSKSFFRRLCEAKGSPEINHETVFCMRKPWDGMPPDEAWRQLPLCDSVVSSPPYADSWHSAGTTTASANEHMRKAGYSEDYIRQQFRASKAAGGNMNAQAYGATTGQLGAMSPGTVEAVISSPPYAGTGEVLGAHNGIDWTKTQGTGQHLTPGRRMQPYGTTEGNLGGLPAGEPLGGEVG